MLGEITLFSCPSDKGSVVGKEERDAGDLCFFQD